MKFWYPTMKTKYVIFDLDDTLIDEINFLKSAYWEIANLITKNDANLYDEMLKMYHQGNNVFGVLEQKYPNFKKEILLEIYRNHFPTLKLNDGAESVFSFCKSKGYKLGLITDGRSITQRNKLKALNIENIFDKIVISEEFGSSKPDERNFLVFQQDDAYTEAFFYIADNTKKDFITPNKLGWTTVCLLDRGQNIHHQSFDIEKAYLPKYKIRALEFLISLIS